MAVRTSWRCPCVFQCTVCSVVMLCQAILASRRPHVYSRRPHGHMALASPPSIYSSITYVGIVRYSHVSSQYLHTRKVYDPNASVSVSGCYMVVLELWDASNKVRAHENTPRTSFTHLYE